MISIEHLSSGGGYKKGKFYRKESVIKAITVIVGLTGIMGQLLLMRELLVTFYGNELIIGVVVANWVILEALGSLTGGKFSIFQRKAAFLYPGFILLYAVVLPGALYVSRYITVLLYDILPGEAVGMWEHLFASLVVLILPAVVHGLLYPLGCAALHQASESDEQRASGHIYLMENLGTLVGGVAFTLVLAGWFHTLTLGVALAVLHLLAALAYMFVVYTSGITVRLIQTFILVIVLLSIGFFGEISNTLHQSSLDRQWWGLDVVHYEDTPYGNITAVESEGEYTFYYDGRSLFTAPQPDLARINDYFHLSASAHPQPEKVLMLGGGLGGGVNTLLEHDIASITYVELDPYLPSAAYDLDASPVVEELEDPRVDLEVTDGRKYLQETDMTYDMIIMGFLSPDTLQSNRLFSSEFYHLARERLADDGVMAFSLPGSREYMGGAMKDLNASIYQTAQPAFQEVELVPGSDMLYFASDEAIELQPEILVERMENREITAEMMSQEYVSYRLDPMVKEETEAVLQGAEVTRNRDLHPAGFFYALQYWGTMFSPGVTSILNFLQQLPTLAYIGGTLAIIGSVYSFTGVRKQRALTFAIFSSGVLGMAFDLFILFIFQTFYGYIYQMTGLLLAAFMLGIFLGSLFGVHGFTSNKSNDQHFNTGLQDHSKENSKIGKNGEEEQARHAKCNQQKVFSRPFAWCEAALVVLVIGLGGLALLMRALSGVLPDPVLIGLFAIFAVIAAFPIGVQFPLAVNLVKVENSGGVRAAGGLYAADLLGGWFSGLAISLVLFPVIGIVNTMMLLALLKVGSWIIVKQKYL